jgi:hypothetical protein
MYVYTIHVAARTFTSSPRCHCHSDPLKDWQKGLLLLARDALEGDLVLGWGKGRGYGGFKVGILWESKQEEIKDWEKLKAYLEKSHGLESLKNWVGALHAHLDQFISVENVNSNQSA